MMIMASFITTSWAFQGLFAEWCPVIKFFFNLVCRNCRLSSGPIHLQHLKFLLLISFSSCFLTFTSFLELQRTFCRVVPCYSRVHISWLYDSTVLLFFPKLALLWSNPSVSTFFPISEFSYFVIRFLNQIFFAINFSYFIIRFYYRAINQKSDNEIGKINDKTNLI